MYYYYVKLNYHGFHFIKAHIETCLTCYQVTIFLSLAKTLTKKSVKSR